MRYIVSISILCFLSIAAFSQNERKHIRSGNGKYEENDYEKSEVEYRKALEKRPESFEAAFNIGDALYKQEKYEEAANQFNMLTSKDISKKDLAKTYHNLGNSLLQSGKLEESIDAYKSALRNDPGDLDTKYNLSYAMRMLKQQQQQQDQNKDNQDQKDQQDQQMDQNQDQKDQEQQQDQNKEQEKKEEQKQQQQISKEDAERLLESLENDEKELQEKLKRIKADPKKVYIEKDW